MAIQQKDAINELRRRFDTLKPRQQAAIQELERRGTFGDSEPVAPKPVETVLPSGVSEEDFARIQRTGLTPGTAVQHAGVSIATENNRRREEGIPGLSAKQQAARLQVFQQQAGTPGSEIKDQFEAAQERERNERGTTLTGRIRSAGLGFASNVGQTGASLVGLFAPENANKISEELRVILNPDGSRAGKAGALLGELSKVTTFAKAGPAGLAAIFGAQGAGGVRQEIENLRREGKEISGLQELQTAAAVGGVEAVSGLVAGKIFGRLGKRLQTASPLTTIGLRQGKAAAVKFFVKDALRVLKDPKVGFDVLAEGAEEGLTQLITNKIRQGVRPELALTEGILESAGTGLLLAPFGAAGSQPTVSTIQSRSQTTPPLTAQEAQLVGQQAVPPTQEEADQFLGAQQQATESQNLLEDRLIRQPQEVRPRTTGETIQPPEAQATAPQTPAEAQLVGQPFEVDATRPEQAVPPVPTIAVDRGTQAVDLSTPGKAVQAASTAKRTPEGTIQLSKAGIAEIRDSLNLPSLPGPVAQEFETELSAAIQEDIPQNALEISQEIIRNPQAITIKTTAGLGARAVALQNLHDSLADTLGTAVNPGQTESISNEMTRMEQELDEITTALNISRSEAGRSLVAGKLQLDRNFNLASTLIRAKSAKNGKPLRLSERVKISSQVTKLKEINKKLKQTQTDPETGVVGEGQTTSKFLKTLGFGSTKVEKLQFQQNQEKAKLNLFINNLKPRSVVQTVSEPLNLVRAILTSADVSAVLRQGGKLAFANPVLASKSLAPMFRALASEQQAFKIDQSIQNRPNGQKQPRRIIKKNGLPTTIEQSTYEFAGLHLSKLNVDAKLNEGEEVFMSRLSKLIPGVRASERAFVTFLNKLRADSFDAMEATLAKNSKVTDGEARVLANFINIATGRGKLNEKIEPAANALATLFFAPRYVASQFQFATLQPLRQREITGRVATLIIKQYVRMLLGFTVVAGLFALAGFEIGIEATSSDFVKFKKGDTRIDLGTGLLQPIVLQQRIQQGETTSPVSGKTRKIRGPKKEFSSDDVFDVLTRFGRTKLAPIPGLALDIAVGENVIGQKVDVKSIEGVVQVAGNNLVPISAQEIWDTMQATDLNIPERAALSVMALFGAGISTFGKKTQQRKERR